MGRQWSRAWAAPARIDPMVPKCSSLGTGPSMSWLERWDRRNQRTAEWHRQAAREKPQTERSFFRIAVWVVVLLVALFRRDMRDLIGFAWTLAILGGLGTVCFVGAFLDQRRKRRAWESAQRGGSSER